MFSGESLIGDVSPRYAQFVDDEDLDGRDGASDSAASSSSGTEMASDEEGDSLQRQIADIPFSRLLKVRRKMQEKDSDNDEMEDEFEHDRPDSESRQAAKRSTALRKRGDRHAPTELSSRRPVSRKRKVVEAKEHQVRDPRFSSLSASAPNKGLFSSSYGFLREKQGEEVSYLRQAFKKLKRQEAHHAGPRAASDLALDIREERQRIESALRREEGRENERRRREHEDEVVRRAKKSIDEKVKQGGKRFYLKNSEVKKLVLEDKFSRLTQSSGGASKRGGVKRAVERRRKKNAAKDRHIPLGGGGRSKATLRRTNEDAGFATTS